MFNFLNSELGKKIYPPQKRQSEDKQIYLFIVRRVSFPFSYLFAKLKFHPSIVTIFSILSGIFGALSFAIGNYIFASLFIFLWQLFDCSDGEVARLTGKTSSLGARLEYLNSNIQYLILIPSLSIGLYLDNLIGQHWVAIAFVGSGLYSIFREMYTLYPEDKLGKPESKLKILIAVQFKNMVDLRVENPYLALSFYLWRNILTQSGILYPLTIIFSLLSNKRILSYIVYSYSILYIAFALLSLLILLIAGIFFERNFKSN